VEIFGSELMARISAILLFNVVLLSIGLMALSSTPNEKTDGTAIKSCGAQKDDDGANKDHIEKIIGQTSSWQASHQQSRPFVTLTFAQSLDGKIAMYMDPEKNETSSNFPISGPESLLLTHALRSIHDAILVGGRTLSIDNPRLSNRLWGASEHQPRPVVLDTRLEHIQDLSTTCRAKNLIVCCSREASSSCTDLPPTIDILPCRVHGDGSLDLSNVLSELTDKFGIRSVMVEGGATVLSAFAKEGLVDCLCVTISPKLLGDKGLPAFSGLLLDSYGSRRAGGDFDSSCFLHLGNDCILLSKWYRG
jgi:3,4-dihydroxy 2-butanone 4-phosphate synthase/GTP cyclohydrolase II